MPFLRLTDLKLHYEITGNGPPLLLIHGLGSSSRNWEKQIEPFSQRYKVVSFDLRGHGQSDKPPGSYSIRMFADDVVALIRALELHPLHVVGISMGGMVAFELAVYFPELLRSLTVVNSYPKMHVESLWEHLQAWRRILFLELLGMHGTGIFLSRHLFPFPEQSELRQNFIQRWAENDKHTYRNSLRAVFNWDVERYLGKINCPVLVVASDHDFLPLDEKRAYTAKIPNAKLMIIENARHAVAIERPEQFNAVLEEFLTDIDE